MSITFWRYSDIIREVALSPTFQLYIYIYGIKKLVTSYPEKKCFWIRRKRDQSKTILYPTSVSKEKKKRTTNWVKTQPRADITHKGSLPRWSSLFLSSKIPDYNIRGPPTLENQSAKAKNRNKKKNFSLFLSRRTEHIVRTGATNSLSNVPDRRLYSAAERKRESERRTHVYIHKLRAIG